MSLGWQTHHFGGSACLPREPSRTFSRGFFGAHAYYHGELCSQIARSRHRHGEVRGQQLVYPFFAAHDTSSAANGPLTSGGHCSHRRWYLVYHSNTCSLALSGAEDSRPPWLRSPEFFSLSQEKRKVLTLKYSIEHDIVKGRHGEGLAPRILHRSLRSAAEDSGSGGRDGFCVSGVGVVCVCVVVLMISQRLENVLRSACLRESSRALHELTDSGDFRSPSRTLLGLMGTRSCASERSGFSWCAVRGRSGAVVVK